MFKGLKSLFAGLLAGTALGILFSPKKGKDIRKDLKSEVDEGGTGLKTVSNTLVEMGKEIKGTCTECYDEIRGSEEYKEGKEKLSLYAKKAKKEVKKVYKDKVPAKTRKKIEKTVTKAKKVAKGAISKAKEVVDKVKQKSEN